MLCMHSMDNRKPSGCPHFLVEMQACDLPADGIYLPLRTQVIDYCRTGFYKKCPTYIQHCLTNNLEVAYSDQDQYPDSRRRHSRIPEKKNVLLRSCDTLGLEQGDFAERAVTIDFSQEGMRVIINRELPSDSFFLFDFGNDFLVPHLQGIAHLCWHRKLEETPHAIEAGFVFKDNFSRAVLALELGN